MKKKESKLEYLAPYLPFKLRIDWIYDGSKRANREILLPHHLSHSFMIHHTIIPHLRPLSELTKEILSEYYTQLMDDDLDRIIEDTLKNPLRQSYTFTTQFLLKNHWDISGLLNAGLAIKK